VKSRKSAGIWRNLNGFLCFHGAHGFIEIGFARRIFVDFAHPTHLIPALCHPVGLDHVPALETIAQAISRPERVISPRTGVGWVVEGGGGHGTQPELRTIALVSLTSSHLWPHATRSPHVTRRPIPATRSPQATGLVQPAARSGLVLAIGCHSSEQ